MALPSQVLYYGTVPGESGVTHMIDETGTIVTSLTFRQEREKKVYKKAASSSSTQHLGIIGVRYSNPLLTIQIEGQITSASGNLADKQVGVVATLSNFANSGANDGIFAGGDTGFEPATTDSTTIIEEMSRTSDMDEGPNFSATVVHYPFVDDTA